MQDYRVFGGVLRSELPWPELRPQAPEARPGPPDWMLRRGAPRELPPGAARLGVHGYAGDVEVALWQAGDLWRVATSDIGDFDITEGGSRIVWRGRENAREELARFDLLGRVLPLALHRAGALSLHGSAAATAGGAVLFLGAKGRGKSTLAMALAQRGAPLLTDDVAVVEPPDGAGPCRVRPGVHAVRLWADSAARLGTDEYGEPGAVGRKLVVHAVPDELRAERAVPLAAVYLLEPAPPDDLSAGSGAPRRVRLAQVEAVRRLLGQVTAGNLLGGPAAGTVLSRVAELARRAPVHTLHLRHDFERLDELAATILGWHPAPGAGAGEAA